VALFTIRRSTNMPATKPAITNINGLKLAVSSKAKSVALNLQSSRNWQKEKMERKPLSARSRR